MTAEIRPLRVEDAGEVLTVQRAAFLSEARLYGLWDLPPLVETVEEIEREIRSQVPALGAWLGGRLAGSVRGRPNGDRMEVARLGVAPDLHRHGIGRRLLHAVCEARPAAIRTLWLVTGGRSSGAIDLYERAGFVRASERIHSTGTPLVFLEKAV